MARSRNLRRLVAQLLLLVGCAAPSLASYPAVNYTWTQQYDWINPELNYDTSGKYYGHMICSLHAGRAAGDDPKLGISITITAWGDGTGNSVSVFQGSQIAFIGTIFKYNYNGPQWDSRTPLVANFDNSLMPGLYTWTPKMGMPWLTPGTNFTVDLSETTVVSGTSGGGGTTDPPPSGGGGLTDTDKSWIQDLFTMSDQGRADWEGFRVRWLNMGPWGQLQDVNSQFGRLNQGDQTYPTGVGNLWIGGHNLGTTKFVDWDNESMNVGAPWDGYSPWYGTTTIKGWKTLFRTILAWALYAMCLIAFAGYLKGRISV